SPAAPSPTPGPGAAAKADANPVAPAWGPKSATATAEKSEVRLGEPFTVQVDVRHDKGEVWSLKAGARLDPFQLRSVQSRTEPSDELEITHLTLELALFKLGSQTVPDLPLVATASHPGSAQAPHEFSLPGPTVKGVASPKSDSKKRDIRGPVPFKVTSFRVLLYALAALAVLGLGLWGYRWWRHRPRREAIALAPPVPEDQLAMQSLSALEAEGLPARGRFKEFHLRLSEILRRYLGDR